MLSLVLPINGKRFVPLPCQGHFLSPDLTKGGLPDGYIFWSDSDRYFDRWHYCPVPTGQ